MSRRTLVIIKPDGVARNLIGKIITRFENKDFKIIKLKMCSASKEEAREHYIEHKDRHFFPNVIKYLCSGPIIVMVLAGPINIFSVVRKMIGSTDPSVALPGTIRGDFGFSKPYNVVHASDSVASANREINIWFQDD